MQKSVKSGAKFWDYIVSFWLNDVGVDSWNICLQNGQYKEIENRTNNAMEAYNRIDGEQFPKKPSLIEFVQITEEESCTTEEKVDDLRKHHMKRPTYK